MGKSILYKLLTHLLVWLIYGYLSFDYIKHWVGDNHYQFTGLKIIFYCLVYILFIMGASYFNYFALLPKYFIKSRFWKYSVYLIISYIIASYLICWVDYFFLRPYKPAWLFSGPHLFSRLPYLILFSLLGNWSALWEALLLKQKEESDWKRDKAEAELKWLKAQINPHFLFNTLNNIVSLVHFKSDKAAIMLVKLSEIMRYVFQEGHHGKTTIGYETEYIKNYIDLHTLKKSWLDKIKLELNIDNPLLPVEPLLLINFIENAFKHANLGQIDSWVKIALKTRGNIIFFSISNTYNEEVTKDKTHGIGLENVGQRLAIAYENKHNLSISADGKIYKVDLKIETD